MSRLGADWMIWISVALLGINALIVAVSLRTLEQNRQKLEELERLWDDCQVYEHVEETEKS